MPDLRVQPSVMVVAAFLITFIIGWVFYATQKERLEFKLVKGSNIFDPIGESWLLDSFRLTLFRCFCCVWCTVTFVYPFAKSGPVALSYYTIWNYILIFVYFALVCGFQLYFHFVKNGVPLTPIGNFWRYLIYIVFQIELPCSVLVTVVYWTVLYPSADSHDQRVMSNFWNVDHHALNVVFIYADLFLNAIPISRHFGVFCVTFAMTYAMFTWIYFAITGDWEYFFLDPSKDWNAMWYIIMWGVHMLCWAVVLLLERWRRPRIDRYRIAVERDRKERLGRDSGTKRNLAVTAKAHGGYKSFEENLEDPDVTVDVDVDDDKVSTLTEMTTQE